MVSYLPDPNRSNIKGFGRLLSNLPFPSTTIEGNGSNHSPILVYPNEQDGIPKVSLPAFGMPSYKFKGSIWTPNGVSEHQLRNSLTKAAENWLRLLQFIQPDFQFFASHGIYHRSDEEVVEFVAQAVAQLPLQLDRLKPKDHGEALAVL
ncbi:hypothetical protein SLEP1_g50587 [Rubroshorea leprosula]|uniref:Uncharacterized protein n=1 Tax=Rubroshorea leprosula TaxID=152421 RepID=A0AAV5M1E8_9ROSI|nr:hypothetical protein SLEP1_g50587 [Rubroshorea leprosula]